MQVLSVLYTALPRSDEMYVSIANRSELDHHLRNGSISLASEGDGVSCPVKLSLIADEATQSDIGPAAGLLAAHHDDLDATWLVIACDYPFLQSAAVTQLIDSYEAPATCFKNSAGFSEPLLGVWSPQALRSLDENVKSGRTGPSYTLRQLNAKLITPHREAWLTNVNTKEEWENAKQAYNDHHKKAELCE